jgi:hypothetical protein
VPDLRPALSADDARRGRRGGAGADHQAGALAYSDVANAWRTYLAKHNKGRPFVLIGHSQGSLMLQELIKREIEGKPVARQMLRAIIPGFNVLVPQGKPSAARSNRRLCARARPRPAA